MTTGPDPAATTPHGLEEGVALALRAEDGGPAAPLLDWLARHPERAGELANFLAAQRGLRSAVAAARPPGGAVGGYDILGELGRGGMGVVYRAYDPRLKRAVALKRVLGGDPGRFRFEAEAAASLDHPHVVRVFDVGEDGGVPFLVMPLMEGGSLAAKLRELGPDRRLSPRAAAGLVRDVARGVHHAHQRGLLHRDLKPANVLLDAAGRPHVADFGLARPLGADVSTAAGTAAYMAPEQARGEKGLTVAVDVHALGAVLYELLTGGPPFGTGDLGGVLKRVLDEPAPPVRRLRPDCPPDLEAVCLRCLEKRPEDRYPSAGALADDLDRFLAGEPVGPRPGRAAAFGRLFPRGRTAVPVGNSAGHLWGAGWTFATQAAAVAAALAGADRWGVFAALMAHLGGWAVLFTLYIWSRAGELNSAERVSGAIKFWALVTVLCLLPAHWSAAGPDALVAYPAVTAVVGFCVLAHGPVHGGREFLAGVVVLAAAAAMPLLPRASWPAAHGLAFGGWALWYGLRMRALDRQARVAPP